MKRIVRDRDLPVGEASTEVASMIGTMGSILTVGEVGAWIMAGTVGIGMLSSLEKHFFGVGAFSW